MMFKVPTSMLISLGFSCISLTCLGCILLTLLRQFFTHPKKCQPLCFQLPILWFFIISIIDLLIPDYMLLCNRNWIMIFTIFPPSGCSLLLKMNLSGTLAPELGQLSHLEIMWAINSMNRVKSFCFQ